MRDRPTIGVRDPNASYKELKPLNSYNVSAYESWLESMAEEGWQLVEFSGRNGVFLPAEPKACRYRLQLAACKEKQPCPERIERWGALGWEYVTSIEGRFHVWRSTGSTVTELNRVEGVGPEDFQRIRRKIRMESGMFIVLPAAVLALMYGSIRWGRTPLWNMVYDDMPGENLLLWLVMLAALIWSVYELGQAMRLLRILEEREPL